MTFKRAVDISAAAPPILERIRQRCLSVEGTEEAISWGHPVFRIGKQAFVGFEEFAGSPSVAFHLPAADIERPERARGFHSTPYGRGAWLSVELSFRVKWSLIEDLVLRSYDTVAPKRTTSAAAIAEARALSDRSDDRRGKLVGMAGTSTPKEARVFRMPFAKIYPLYVKKAEKKGRTRAEVDAVICWLTGYNPGNLTQQIEAGADLKSFFDDAPFFNPNSALIKGLVCGVRVESVEDPLMRKIRYLDKLVDELAKGKSLDKILRE